jgi:hypothetical protein
VVAVRHRQPAGGRIAGVHLSRERADEMVPLGFARFCSKPRVVLTVVHLALGSIVPKYLPYRDEHLWYAVVKMALRKLRETVGTRCKEIYGDDQQQA